MNPKIKVHSEGYLIILIVSLVSLGLCVAYKYCFSPQYSFLSNALCVVHIAIVAMIIFFFRYPFRWIEKDENAIFSPADGKIVIIEEKLDQKYSQQNRIQISIFMSPMNVHVNFYPMSGEIVMTDYYPGDKIVAWHPKSSDLNEHSAVWIEDKENKSKSLIVKQIAGAMARRIVCFAKKGETVEQGEELGIIKFGSRVDVLLPATARINVELGQRVKAKKTILAYFE
ncbi:MAG: phosphatidylserine decarboxylase family protein [Bacteroidales bacterium]|jgi:phosphatidylserine decarboxylase|nr:phosphatidylserine decarboxylase family protein [Bacteroidales bacterium]